jgi:hypothetical protein
MAPNPLSAQRPIRQDGVFVDLDAAIVALAALGLLTCGE